MRKRIKVAVVAQADQMPFANEVKAWLKGPKYGRSPFAITSEDKADVVLLVNPTYQEVSDKLAEAAEKANLPDVTGMLRIIVITNTPYTDEAVKYHHYGATYVVTTENSLVEPEVQLRKAIDFAMGIEVTSRLKMENQ